MGDQDGVIHDEVEIEDFDYDPTTGMFNYPCPCGDEFLVSREELQGGGKYAKCPSCSLMVEVVFDPADLESIIESKLSQRVAKKTQTGLRATS